MIWADRDPTKFHLFENHATYATISFASHNLPIALFSINPKRKYLRHHSRQKIKSASSTWIVFSTNFSNDGAPLYYETEIATATYFWNYVWASTGGVAWWETFWCGIRRVCPFAEAFPTREGWSARWTVRCVRWILSAPFSAPAAEYQSSLRGTRSSRLPTHAPCCYVSEACKSERRMHI